MEYASSDITSLALLAATLGILILGVPLLIFQSKHVNTVAPLIVFLMASSLSNALPLFIAIFPALNLYSLGICLVGFMAIPSSLWLYVAAITSPTPWHLTRSHYWHFLPVGIAMLIACLLFALPVNVLKQVFDQQDANLEWWPELLVIAAFATMVIWVCLSAGYLIAIIKRLLQFRQRLKSLFANNDKRELHWLSWAIVALAGTWGLSLLYSIPLLMNLTPPLPVQLVAAAHLILMWAFALFGIQQKPSFEGRYLPLKLAQELTQNSQEKYVKSGLSDDSLTRIAQKLNGSMRDGKLYLDSNLSLQKLATELAISSNSISQALNKKLKTSFFDFINGWRIKHAIPEVLSGEKSILDVAMDAGFNARSSFYKAFKNETGCSPTEYRKNNRNLIPNHSSS